jgi:hypothetical protein
VEEEMKQNLSGRKAKPTFQSLGGSKNAMEIEWHPKRDEGVARGRKKKRKKEKNLNGTYLNTQKGIRRCKLEEKQAEKEKKSYTVDAP